MRKPYSLDGAQVLQLLSDEAGITWSGLCHHLSLDSQNAFPFGKASLLDCLLQLAKLGLIEMDGAPQRGLQATLQAASHGTNLGSKIRPSKRWQSTMSALSARVSGVSYDFDTHAMLVHPRFGAPTAQLHQPDVFVVMPFALEFSDLYHKCIVPACETVDVTVSRGDKYFTANTLIDDIWNAIAGCGMIIADCTGANPNVFYEVGVAHAVGKPVVLLTQHRSDVPANLYINHIIEYEPNADGLQSLHSGLCHAMSMELGLWRRSAPR
jgi:hypothetical protein